MPIRAPTTVLAALRQRIQRLDGSARQRRAVLPFGVPAIDARLPDGGLALGALHEVAGGGNGAIDGAAAALFASGIAARTRGRVLWCVTRQDLFAPALAAAGLAPDRVIYVEAGDEKTLLACFEEGLRHGSQNNGLGAVVAEVARLSMTASRRLQLAAEGSGAIGIAIRRLPFYRTRDTTISLRTGASHTELPLPLWGRDGVGGRSWGMVVPHLLLTPTPIPSPPGGGEEFAEPTNRNFDSEQEVAAAGRGQPPYQSADFAQPTAAVTRWRVSALPSTPLPTAGVGRARWRLELIRCRGGEGACFDVEACDAQGRLALPSNLADGPGQEASQEALGPRRAAR